MEKIMKQDLAEFLANNCEYVDSEEQKEIDRWMNEMKVDTDEGREISLQELLKM